MCNKKQRECSRCNAKREMARLSRRIAGMQKAAKRGKKILGLMPFAPENGKFLEIDYVQI
ncbi:hypothetical protein QG055_09310 [Kingella kingae]|uniref:hypothetical protein n=1 Tax=Kingella kingae TaxID=504 RepID=UPI0025507EED|nr:hypothetical protein [Kingella kingae]MDK4579058.1 hypothetical protein [Kingella kingae]MDK4609459.1 hypothetical protein [Kingella kingae]MDK4627397.1 hypothetical protein [Kingella kingae]